MTVAKGPRRASQTAGAPFATAKLPVASGRQVRNAVIGLLRRRYGWWFAATTVLHAAAAAAALGPPVLLGQLIDTIARADGASAAERFGAVDRIALGIAVLLLAFTALTWAASLTMGVLSEQALAELRQSLVRDAIHLPLSVVELAGTGDLVSRTSSDVDALDDSLRRALPAIFAATITISVILVGAVGVSAYLALSVLVVLPVLVPVVAWYRHRSPQAFADVRAGLAAMTATIEESTAGARTVETLRWEQRRIARLDGEIARTWRSYRRVIRLRTALFPAIDITMFLPLLVALLVGGALALQGSIRLGEVATGVILMQMLMAPMTQLVLALDDLQMGNAALARIVGVSIAEPAHRPSMRIPSEEPDADVRLQGVRFGYSPDREVLHGIDLTLRRGERLAVVGPTGAGKSTLARLVAGIHAPTAGSVTVGGVPLIELGVEQLRRRVALLTQEHHVFVGTLADNLRLAAPQATDEEVARALARVGGAAWLARLSDGLDTQLAGEHRTPTPKEAQLIALARVALAAPPTLVLDEATSQLDAGAAKRAESALAEILSGRTVVMVAHRLHTAHDADRIAVIRRGHLVELGTHEQLMTRGGTYRELWETWQGRLDD